MRGVSSLEHVKFYFPIFCLSQFNLGRRFMPWIYFGKNDEKFPTPYFSNKYPEYQFEILERINLQFNKIESETDRHYSSHVRTLVMNTILAIQEDPSPSWKDADEKRRTQVVEDFIYNLPKLLDELSRSQDYMNKHNESYFDVLHWLTSRLDSICPFPK